ncbi:uncharacterized protein LOC118511358 [Anopheles stephensi]|uniref:uncharacterized protein LOC118511358 n=1 Tax=Anopheles stephensi TaxID=30069 RepID=UPI0007D6AFFC|nr:uncharacterized protein LOC118511358 [Anopheles stephensi]
MENSCKATCYELFPDALPAFDTVPSLEAELRQGAKERLASKKLIAQQKATEKRHIVPTVTKLMYPSPPKYRKCHHSDNFVLDREVLKPDDHIAFIARPKEVQPRKRPYYIRHKLSSATNRIKTLARPGTSHVKATLEHYSTQLSPKQVQHLRSRLEPKPFVTIEESIGYARQQRSDDAMWRRHMARQERKLLHKIHHWEIEILRHTMETLAKRLREFYLSPADPVPLTEEAERISREVLGCICRFLDVPMPAGSRKDSDATDSDVIDDFFVEFSQKVGHWVWRMMQQTGLSFCKQKSFSYARTSESFISVNSSVFELPAGGDEVAVGEEQLDPLSILSLELVHDCLDAAVLTVEQGIFERRNSVCIESEVKSGVKEEEIATEMGETSEKWSELEGSDTVTEPTLEALDDDQVTVIENIPNDETDEEMTDPVGAEELEENRQQT